LGIIDSLRKGFQTVYRYWWLILVPVLLDTFLWIGPQASAEHLTQQIVDVLTEDMADISSEGISDWRSVLQALREVASQYNGFSTLRVGALGVPSLMTWRGAPLGSPSAYEALWIFFSLLTNRPDLLVSVPDATFINVPVWQFPHQVNWLLSSILLTAAGIMIGCTYLMSIARGLSSPEDSWAFWPRVWKLGGRFVLFWILRTLALIMLGIPFILVLVVLSALSPALASLAGTVALGIVTWVSFYGIFFIAALVMNDASIWRAIWNSFNVVLRNFGTTFTLFLLINLIGGGLTILWQKLSTGSWLTFIGIVGNAYVGTSLVVASLVFYHDRYTKWREAIAKLLSDSGRRTA